LNYSYAGEQELWERTFGLILKSHPKAWIKEIVFGSYLVVPEETWPKLGRGAAERRGGTSGT
jgi:hypothetical protein